jgi:hypothetical protein
MHSDSDNVNWQHATSIVGLCQEFSLDPLGRVWYKGGMILQIVPYDKGTQVWATFPYRGTFPTFNKFKISHCASVA